MEKDVHLRTILHGLYSNINYLLQWFCWSCIIMIIYRIVIKRAIILIGDIKKFNILHNTTNKGSHLARPADILEHTLIPIMDWIIGIKIH